MAQGLQPQSEDGAATRQGMAPPPVEAQQVHIAPVAVAQIPGLDLVTGSLQQRLLPGIARTAGFFEKDDSGHDQRAAISA